MSNKVRPNFASYLNPDNEAGTPKQIMKMADPEFRDLPLKGKLIVQKITENESNLTVIVQKIKKCEGSRLDITNLRNDAQKAMQAIKSELEVRISKSSE